MGLGKQSEELEVLVEPAIRLAVLVVLAAMECILVLLVILRVAVLVV